MHSLTRPLWVAAVATAPWLFASPAAGQMAHIPETDWRQADRHDVVESNAGRPSFAFEVRLGPYLPHPDDEFTASHKTPFQDAFGYDCDTGASGAVSPRFFFGLEADALPVRIPYVGMFGIGVGWGYTSFSNLARLTKYAGTGAQSTQVGASTCSAQSTTLTIMPMHASLVLRIDELMRHTGIPIVPYGKIGAGFSFWRASTNTGTEMCSSKSSDAAAAAFCTTERAGVGLAPALHWALGGMLALNFLDPRSAARLDETTGVRHAYLFGEWYSDTIMLADKVLQVGNSNWVGGLAVDL